MFKAKSWDNKASEWVTIYSSQVCAAKECSIRSVAAQYSSIPHSDYLVLAHSVSRAD